MGMSLVLTLCTALGCNAYVIDTPPTKKECVSALVLESQYMARVWHDANRLESYVSQFDAKEPATSIIDYDFTCEAVDK